MPMNCMIEIEMICDSIHVENEPEDNYMVELAGQDFYITSETYVAKQRMGVKKDKNRWGEIFYVRNCIEKSDLDHKQNATCVPVNEIIDVNAPWKKIQMCERTYKFV